jgi:hypothetical protein
MSEFSFDFDIGPSKEVSTPKVPKEQLPTPVGARHYVGLRIPKGHSERIFRNVISAAYTAWVGNRGTMLPSVDDIHRYYPECAKRKISAIIATEEFGEAIRNRGLPWNSGDYRAGLTSTQQFAISIITNPTDKRGLKAKLASAGVTYSQYRAWLKDPVFNRYMNTITEGMLSDHTGDLHTALMNRALNGDLNAIKYVYELNGRFDPASRQMQDVSVLVERIIEIVIKNIHDPVVLNKITGEMRGVIAGNTIKGEISA